MTQEVRSPGFDPIPLCDEHFNLYNEHFDEVTRTGLVTDLSLDDEEETLQSMFSHSTNYEGRTIWWFKRDADSE